MSIFDDPFDFNHDGTVDGGEMAMAYEFFLKDNSSNHNDGWGDEEEEDFFDDEEMMDEMDEEW